MLTLNQIIDQIKTLANAHYQIAEVGVGTIAELQAKPDRSYPLLWISHEQGSLQDNYKINNIRLTIFDRVISGEEGQDDSGHEQEVLSDTELILLDFLNYFHQNHSQDYVTVKQNTLEHFTERTNDRTAGWSTFLELKQFYDWNKCQIPQSGASIPPTVDGLTLYDFCDADVIARLTPTQTACLEAELCGACDDASVRNSDSSYANTVASGGTLVLPDITVTDSDGSTSNVPSVQDVTCTPCPTLNLLSVTFSDNNPDLGDSVTITATATGITPTSYTFYLPDIYGNYTIVTQVSNTYVWTAEGNGSQDIVVESTDGVDTVFGQSSIDVDFPYLYDDHSGMSAFYGLFKANSAYSGDCMQVQRSSDGAYLEVGFVNGCVIDLPSLKSWAGADEVKITKMYDTTGNGNDLEQNTASLQVGISNLGGIKLFQNGIQSFGTNSMKAVFNTNPYLNSSTVDIYTTVEITDLANSGVIRPLMNSANMNAGFTLLGQSGSATTSISARFGSPSFFLNGSASGWSNRGDVYSDLFNNGLNQITVIGGDLTDSLWVNNGVWWNASSTSYWTGTQQSIAIWTTDTSSVRTTIESKINALGNVTVD